MIIKKTNSENNIYEFSIQHYLFNSWPQVNVNDCTKPFTEFLATILYKKYIFILNIVIQYKKLYTLLGFQLAIFL